MNKKLFNAIEVAVIGGLILAVLYWGGIFDLIMPAPPPTATLLPTVGIRTGTPRPTPTATQRLNIEPGTAVPTATPISASPPLVEPSGLIAFNGLVGLTHEIYTVDAGEALTGNGRRNITNNTADDYLLSWSPDGSRIAFFSTRTGWLELFVMDADGANVVQLTDHQAENFGGVQTAYIQPVSWSPDGAYLLAARTNAWSIRQTLQITLIDRIFTDGSGIENVYSSSETIEGVRLSPDGQYVAMNMSSAESSGLYVARLTDAGLMQPVYKTACDQFMWVPHSRLITCVQWGRIFVTEADAFEQNIIASLTSGFPMESLWSPDGRALLVQIGGQTGPDTLARYLSLFTRDDTPPRIISNNLDILLTDEPDWSWASNSQWIAFTSDYLGQQNIYIVNAYNPTDVRQLTAADSSFAPQWQPQP